MRVLLFILFGPAAFLPIDVGKNLRASYYQCRGDVLESSCTVSQSVPITQVKVDSSSGAFISNKLVQLYWPDPTGTAN
ncbi:hypothetical protein [Runella slithyformis]|uniref:Uncharacterized protein n=1 Tax=Runella slithyformis (strain ATCC 29530 / DSM 19594 / LMG 11500 / NCIMB 11436 / LSU 4) TaxID=761193 RepID=A0A7U3ZJT9_RUNSL|nr:hypothetical protein [Runella slithyformis]AEI48445.1 hypothetical protein Runsl_2029 [Runella slithyformis DSM 19594]